MLRALGALGISQITQALGKGGSGVTFPAPITRDGPGWRADVDLPFGVTVSDIMERRERLASGLRRELGCVWPEPDSDQHAGRLVLWVGDQPMSKARQPAWPLAKSGQANVFAPVPFGTDQRARPVALTLMFNSVLIGAMPRQGKTFALRVLALALTLDPRVELRVFELKGTGDLSPVEKVAHHYGCGPDDATVHACLESLREIERDLQRRSQTIARLPKSVCPENKVTPQLAARQDLGLAPVAVVIDECQELFTHPQHGDEADRLATRITKLGPAMGIMLLLATQRPDSKSLPTGVSANAGLRFCLRVMGQTENDMVLGTSAYKNGTRATMFTAKDKGIGYLVGAADDPQIARSYYLDAAQAEKVTDRARALREAAGTLTGHAIGQDMTTEAEGNTDTLLADILAVTGPEATGAERWNETIAACLAEHRPDVYGQWGAEQLTTALKPHGIRTGQVWGTGEDGQGRNRRGIDPTQIVKILTERNRKRDSH